MKLRTKFFIILGISQILLILSLVIVFTILITSVKDEPQNYRAIELVNNFTKELKDREVQLKNLISELNSNPKYIAYFESIFRNRPNGNNHSYVFEKMKNDYHINVMELGNRYGDVFFRFHRPEDFGDNKKNQTIIENALKGMVSSTIEVGHSGLALRATAPISNGTLLLGQVIDRDFLFGITGSNKVKIALFSDGKLITSSDTFIERFIKTKNYMSEKNPSRLEFDDQHFYITSLDYLNKDLSILKIKFLVMIDESDMNKKTETIWEMFFFVTFLIFLVILFISYLFSRGMINSIRKLNLAMVNLEYKNAPIDIDTKRKDEIGDMGKVFLSMKEEIFKYQNHLESLVNEKTLHLQNSLDEIRKLKEHQDGDYFLTSLLLQPFYIPNYSSEKVAIDSILKQKKKFSFRNKSSEIGGDVIMMKDLEINKNSYLAFINADAMGKSIQGAGGALVLGTVFKSFLNRIQKEKNSMFTPETFLLECFDELDKVFLSFDGSMIVSAIIGLIDQNTGAFFFINSEHPYPVLLKNGETSFIGFNQFNRKIGLDYDDEIFVNSFQMEEGDIIIIGTDGRDDLLVNLDGKISMNEDEKLFLSVVKKASGNLTKIEKELGNSGEFTDDLSLLKIEYRNINNNYEEETKYLTSLKSIYFAYKNGEFDRAESEAISFLLANPNNLDILRIYCKLLMKNKNYPKATIYLSKYIQNRPADSIFLFYLSVAYKKIGEYELSLDLGRRYFLRYPANKQILLHLIELYTILEYNNEKEYFIDKLNKIEGEIRNKVSI